MTVGNSRSELKASKESHLVLPSIGLAVDVNPVKYVNIFADGPGILAGKYGYMADAEVGVKVIHIKWFSIVDAYRYLELKAKDGSSSGKVTYNGPYVGLTIRY